MRTTIDSPSHEEGTFSEYQTLESKTRTSLTISVASSLNGAGERLVALGVLRLHSTRISSRISASVGRSVVAVHETLTGIAMEEVGVEGQINSA